MGTTELYVYVTGGCAACSFVDAIAFKVTDVLFGIIGPDMDCRPGCIRSSSVTSAHEVIDKTEAAIAEQVRSVVVRSRCNESRLL